MDKMITTCYGDIPENKLNSLKNINTVILDIDGTITEGGVYLDKEDLEFKRFNTKDGLGISLLIKNHFNVAVITGRNSPLVTRRMKELLVTNVIQGQSDKEHAILQLIKDFGITKENVAVIGDDINDIPLYKNAAISFCPQDGHPYMQKIASFHLTKKGGFGACREMCDLLLMAKGILSYDGGPI